MMFAEQLNTNALQWSWTEAENASRWYSENVLSRNLLSEQVFGPPLGQKPEPNPGAKSSIK